MLGVRRCTAMVMAVSGFAMISGCASKSPAPEIGPKESQAASHETAADTSKKSTPQVKKQPAKDKPTLVDDDGKTLWVSPTHGRPLDLAYLSPGAQVIAALRPAAMLKHPEAEKVRAALGPSGQAGIVLVEQITGTRLANMERLLIGGQVTSDGKWLVTFVVHATNPISRNALLAKLPGAAEKDHDGKNYWLAAERAYYLPAAGRGKVLVVAPPEAIADIIDLAGSPPPLRRDIERLIDHTDADRDATIVVAPNSLFGDGESIFAGQWAGLRGPLFWFFGDELSGAALSAHWADNFFIELVATPTLDTPPEKAMRTFAARIAKVPDMLETYVVGLNPQAYGRQMVIRFPAMVRKLATYTRSSFAAGRIVLRCYLPAVAGHNLIMAAELTLAEPPGGKALVAAADSTSAGASANSHDRLAKKTSLRFAKDTLEAALEQLSQDIGVPIVIRGPDLQSEGITKNQSFGIDISNKPAQEILVQILRLANPDKSAKGASDPLQKLVYIIEHPAGKDEQIVVTTRAKAAERHDELPPAFRPAKP